MKKIGFVIPWFGTFAQGGAENLCKEVAIKLKKSGLDVEILTTCIKNSISNYGINYYKEGTYIEEDLKVKRFEVKPTNKRLFFLINDKLSSNEKISDLEEEKFYKTMIDSDDLDNYLVKNEKEYTYIFIPYLFSTTIRSILNLRSGHIMIPCMHEEPYVHLNRVKKAFRKTKYFIFNSEPEKRLAEKLYPYIRKKKKAVIGIGIEKKEMIEEDVKIEPYLLYIGRKEVHKNVPLLLEYFKTYKKRNKNNLSLILMGPGKIDLPEKDISSNYIKDIGFLKEEEKYKLIKSCTGLCNPSTRESLSITILEAWMMKKPVIVNGKCRVTKSQCLKSNGGLWFDNYFEFEKIVNLLISNNKLTNDLGENGYKYVIKEYNWERIINKYLNFIKNAN